MYDINVQFILCRRKKRIRCHVCMSHNVRQSIQLPDCSPIHYNLDLEPSLLSEMDPWDAAGSVWDKRIIPCTVDPLFRFYQTDKIKTVS